ncbi:peptidylprolyl isomerase [Methyloversatilis sp. XJ19-13]|uniref:peptidylprolyl isomerase n=1 Tax=unclassified Methyloversatilis TaxID=2639971 RepID=UPI00211BE9CC|nr:MULTISPECIES: peptidylprolyl isomerase [unclassified Methyloversatilis]MCQ9372687.1 peptidylprolyl isomerase [Methyloversatilis sp. XJ19-13]MDP3874437.1 peptidylprolyl isomerase [Methyloversatilis sp.]
MQAPPAAVARVNGVAVSTAGESLPHEALQQRTYTELLRQTAQRAGLLSADDLPTPDGVISEAASAAIDLLIERSVQVPEPSEEACARHYAAHEAAWRTGERVRVRHILFAVTQGVDVVALRKRAEGVLLDVRCHDGKAEDVFAHAAEQFSNCPSGAHGGELDWLTPTDCAPEFARELFGHVEVGVLPRLVHSRFGLHVVEVLERDPGRTQAYESVRGAVAGALRQQSFVTALRQYLSVLAGEAEVEGIDLNRADSPLVQ